MVIERSDGLPLLVEELLEGMAAGATARLLRCPGDDAHAADLLERARQPTRAAEVLVALAHRDIARGALRNAAQRLDRATTLAGDVPGLLIERVRLLTLSGRAVDALQLGSDAVDRLAGDAHAQLRLQLARAAIEAARWAAATEHVRRAGRPDDPRSLLLAADAAFGDHRGDDARNLAIRAVGAAERVDDPEVLCEALIVAARAAQVAAQHRLMPWRVEALRTLGLVELHTGLTSASLIRGGHRRLG